MLLSLEERWGSWRALLQAFFVATALLLVGAAREWGELETGRVSAWIFLGGLVGLALLLLALYVRMEGSAKTPAPAVSES